MRKIISLTICLMLFNLSFCIGQNHVLKAIDYYNNGVDFLTKGDNRSADSLFTLSIDLDYTVEAFYNRSLARKRLGDTEGYCKDIFMATANGDPEAKALFLNSCTVNDTTYLDSNDSSTSKELAIKTKISAKRKHDSNTDIIIIDSLGNEFWSNEVDSAIFKAQDKDSIIQRMPSFPGAEPALVNFLGHNIKYPVKALKYAIQGTVFITFVIDNHGYVKEPKVTEDADVELAKEALRVIRAMPQWFPGMQEGRFVSVQYNLPVKFTLR